MKNLQVETRIGEYLEVLDKKMQEAARVYTHLSDSHHEVEYGRRFAKIWTYERGRRSHIHSFVEIETGDVIKAATIKAPQKNADGTFSVRFNLLDDASRELMFGILDIHGGYLYKR